MYVSSCSFLGPPETGSELCRPISTDSWVLLTVGHRSIRRGVRTGDIPGQAVRVAAPLRPVRRQQDDALLVLPRHRCLGLLLFGVKVR